jgi:hypothetical protein
MIKEDLDKFLGVEMRVRAASKGGATVKRAVTVLETDEK